MFLSFTIFRIKIRVEGKGQKNAVVRFNFCHVLDHFNEIFQNMWILIRLTKL